jgi:hypothetical protein
VGRASLYMPVQHSTMHDGGSCLPDVVSVREAAHMVPDLGHNLLDLERLGQHAVLAAVGCVRTTRARQALRHTNVRAQG